MITPCQTYAKENGVEALDKMLFTTPVRAAKAIPLLCDNCPSKEKNDCAKRAQSIVTPAGIIPAFGVFGGVWHG
jgi:hypothetical protein